MNAKSQDKLALIVGANIASRRKRKKITQRDLAARLGITSGSLCRIESGGNTPHVGRLQAIAECLDCSVADLFRCPEDPSCTIVDDIVSRVGSLQKEVGSLVAELRRLNRIIN
ncbi:XRE family transcriptional regulator [Desulfovibrio desulfuricans]|jgi:Predicted transcriptional regulators|uniref:XRE family transcriptional regulator n=1 Tax=Desulfovibrio desulfuricans TaxID=876 RepID=A0A4P7UQJ3_DESDE|nr:helix-turn-helix transcriptional regulator [Desulfovibrio desulfuricans]QCC85872.1 XRE family transcriptional regulator [Desulfovibrio desulfuricans]